MNTTLHEYGHYLQSALDDMSTFRPTWLNQTEWQKGRQAIQAAMSSLNQYAFRTLSSDVSKITTSVEQYTKRGLIPQNIQSLREAFIDLSSTQIGNEFGGACQDLTGHYIDAGYGHNLGYLTGNNFLSWPQTGKCGPVVQEVLNEFTTGYISATLEERALIDSTMYAKVPDLWTGMHRWIDFILGAH